MPGKKPKHINEQPVSTNYNPYPGGPMTEQQYQEFGFKNKDVDRIYGQESIKVKNGMPYNENFMKKVQNQKIKA
jgi:hypothetical protein